MKIMHLKIALIALMIYGCNNPGNMEIEFIEFNCSPTPDPRLDECITHAKPKWILNCHKTNYRSRNGLACRGYRENR